jgi:hypothetical protein
VRGPTLPGFRELSEAPHTGPVRVGYSDLDTAGYRPRSHVLVDVYVSSLDSGDFQQWEARWADTNTTRRPPAWIQLYPGLRVASQGRTLLGVVWPHGEGGQPLVLEVARVGGGMARPWSVLVVPSACYVGQPVYEIDELGQIEPAQHQKLICEQLTKDPR